MATPLRLSSLACLEQAIRAEWCADTAWSAEHWRADRPAAGQCFSTAHVIRSLLGGEIVHAEVPHTDPKQHHAWNRLPSGLLLDLTGEQFPAGQTFHERTLPEALVWQHGGRQAQLLLDRVRSRIATRVDNV